MDDGSAKWSSGVRPVLQKGHPVDYYTSPNILLTPFSSISTSDHLSTSADPPGSRRVTRYRYTKKTIYAQISFISTLISFSTSAGPPNWSSAWILAKKTFSHYSHPLNSDHVFDRSAGQGRSQRGSRWAAAPPCPHPCPPLAAPPRKFLFFSSALTVIMLPSRLPKKYLLWKPTAFTNCHIYKLPVS